MSGGKGGSSTSRVTVPQYIEDAARRNLSRADDISNIGYVPEYGPTVAGLTPMQIAAAQNVSDTASAFGLSGGDMSERDLRGGMDAPTEYAGGVRGYSAQPIYQGMVDELQAARPGQYDYINSFSIDPVTGELGIRANPQSAPMGTDLGGMYAADRTYVPNENSTQDEGMAAARASYNATGGTAPSQNGGSNFFKGLKDFATDATDGGGMGDSNGKYKGLGLYSGIANVLGGKY